MSVYHRIGRPREDGDIKWWRQWLVTIIFGLWNEKKEMLAEQGWPSRPVSQQEIFREVNRRIYMMKKENLWIHSVHGHNWVERRVNELCTEELGPTTDEGVLKIVRTSDNCYIPNPELFQ